MIGDDAVDGTHHLELQPFDLGNRLDDEIRFAHGLEVGGQLDPLAHGARLGVVELAPAYGSRDRRFDPALRSAQRLLVDVAHDHRHARDGNRLGDAGAHEAPADDCYGFDLAHDGRRLMTDTRFGRVALERELHEPVDELGI